MINRKIGERIAITGGNETETLTGKVVMGPHGKKTLAFSRDEKAWIQFSPESMQDFLNWAQETE